MCEQGQVGLKSRADGSVCNFTPSFLSGQLLLSTSHTAHTFPSSNHAQFEAPSRTDLSLSETQLLCSASVQKFSCYCKACETALVVQIQFQKIKKKKQHFPCGVGKIVVKDVYFKQGHRSMRNTKKWTQVKYIYISKRQLLTFCPPLLAPFQQFFSIMKLQEGIKPKKGLSLYHLVFRSSPCFALIFHYVH